MSNDQEFLADLDSKEKFIEQHGGMIAVVSFYGQEANSNTKRLAIMSSCFELPFELQIGDRK